jgi:ankyrin repeat protein
VLDELKILLHDINSIGNRIKIIITSRPQIPLKDYFSAVVEISLDSNNQNDISNYVHAGVSGLKQRNFPADLREEIREALIKGSNGMFLWVYLILYELKTSSQTSENAVRQKMKTLPSSLPDLYTKILLAIEPDDLETANNILRWVVWAERPLSLEELRIAIAIQPGHRSMSVLSDVMEFDLGNVLRSILGSLVKVQNDRVGLVHQSAKDFLKGTNKILSERLSLQSYESNLHITISCVTYLSFREISDFNVDTNPFFWYSSTYWPDHMRRLDRNKQLTPNLRKAFVNLARTKSHFKRPSWTYIYLDPYVRIISGQAVPPSSVILPNIPNLMRSLVDYMVLNNPLVNGLGNALYAAAFFGKADIVRYLVEHGADVNAMGGRYGSALSAAASSGKADIVRYLVDHGADVNAEGSRYGSALRAAASSGKADIVRYLVEHGADVNAKGGRYGSALYAAVISGMADIVRYLVDHGADVNAERRRYGNALTAAAFLGKADIVRYLVEHGANIDTKGGLYYCNALCAAFSEGNYNIVRYLKEHRANINATDGEYGYTFFSGMKAITVLSGQRGMCRCGEYFR